MASKPLSKSATTAGKGKKRPLTARDVNATDPDKSEVEPKTLKNAKKALGSEGDSIAVTLDSFKTCAFDPSVVSIYAIAE